MIVAPEFPEPLNIGTASVLRDYAALQEPRNSRAFSNVGDHLGVVVSSRNIEESSILAMLSTIFTFVSFWELDPRDCESCRSIHLRRESVSSHLSSTHSFNVWSEALTMLSAYLKRMENVRLHSGRTFFVDAVAIFEVNTPDPKVFSVFFSGGVVSSFRPLEVSPSGPFATVRPHKAMT